MSLKPLILTISSLFEKKLSRGKMIHHYEIRDILGMGSYGYSYLVLNQQTKRLSVLKMLRFHKRIILKGRLSFQKEMAILKSLSHSRFPVFYEEGEFDHIPFYTMEYISGKTFEQLIFDEGNIYSEAEAFSLGLELLSLITVLHEKGIIHRDIRIPNIMMDDGKIKLIDFGLARRMDNHHNELISYPVPKKIAPISDFYGLGHFLLFLLYSGYAPIGNQKEKPWEEELEITKKGKHVIKRLLLIESSYLSTNEIFNDIEEVILESRRK